MNKRIRVKVPIPNTNNNNEWIMKQKREYNKALTEIINMQIGTGSKGFCFQGFNSQINSIMVKGKFMQFFQEVTLQVFSLKKGTLNLGNINIRKVKMGLSCIEIKNLYQFRAAYISQFRGSF